MAAVRVLEHRLARPPTYEEIGDLLGISHEIVGQLARSLESRGILSLMKTPFDVKVEIRDHTALEDLPQETAGAAMKGEVEEFLKKARGRQEDLEKKLAGAAFQKDQKKKFEDLEAQLKEFQKQKVRDPFSKPGKDTGVRSADEETGAEGA